MNRFRECFLSMLVGCCCLLTSAYSQTTVHSIAELRALTNSNSQTIVLAAGEYWLDGDFIANPSNSEPIFLNLAGNNNTYDFSQAVIKVDTRKLDGFGRNLGHSSAVRPIRVAGSFNTILGLTLIGVDVDLDTDPNAQRHADWGTNYVQFQGSNNRMINAFIETRGSFPYGLTDAFGKGASQGVSPYISHRKAGCIQVLDATNPYFENLTLDVNTYGHGFFVQGTSTNTTLVDSTVTGELFPSSNVINHPLYQQFGYTHYQNPIPENIMFSGAEDGVRLYNGPSGFTVDNVVVTNMRTGFAVTHGSGNINISNSATYGADSGFDVGSNTTITNCEGDITNGPLLWFPTSNARNNTVDLRLVGDVPVGVNWSVAYLNGNDLDVTISSDLPAGALPADSVIRLGQKFFEDWRNNDSPTGPNDDPDDFIDSVFTNNTHQTVVLGDEVSDNVGDSLGSLISNGKANYYDGQTIVPAGTVLVAQDDNALGNSGDFDQDTDYSNGTIVEDGATLQVLPNVRINDEQVTISGAGVGGQGAIYSDGADGNGTRVVGEGNIIVLDGDATVGVGIAGNSLLISRIAGTGDFTKIGAGSLSVEDSSVFSGNFLVEEGEVVGRRNVFIGGLTVSNGASIRAISDNMLSTDGIVNASGIIDLNGRTEENVITGRVGTLLGSSGGLVTVSNPAAGAGATLEISADSGFGVFNGSIDSFVSITKTGGSSQVFNGTLTHTGTTTVEAGSLMINGSHTGGDDYQIDGGTFGGLGSITADVTVASDAVLAPGLNVGRLTVGQTFLLAGSELAIEIGGTTAGSEHDQLVTQTALLGGQLTVELVDGFQPSAGDSFVIVRVDGDTLFGSFVGLPANTEFTTPAGDSFIINYAGGDGNDVVLTATAGEVLYGDVNMDGVVDLLDVGPFVDLILSGGDYTAEADVNMDGVVDLLDVSVFVSIILGG